MPKISIDLTSLQVFMSVCEDFNMSLAAKRLNLTQPAVSSCIHKLEKIVDAELFDRSSRPLKLTQVGRVLFNRANSLLNSLDQLSSDMIAATRGKKLDLRLAASDSVTNSILPYLIGPLLQQINYLSITGGHTPQVCRLLADNKADIVSGTDFMQMHRDVHVIPSHVEDFIIVAPKEYNDRLHSISDVVAMANHLPVIQLNDQSLDAVQIERVLRQCNIEVSRSIEVDSDRVLVSTIASGLGWCVLPPLGLWAAKEFLPGTSLHKIPALHGARNTYVLYRDIVYASMALDFTHMMQQVIETKIRPEMEAKYPVLAQSLRVTQ
ncbi:MAG TPA: hypothetical protein DCW60_04105 [Sutterella sp.]|nr:hypothetical protein [Sutterella sp.]